MGEEKRKSLRPPSEAIALDTFGGRIHVEWDPAAAVTPLGQLPFFIEFLKVSGLFEDHHSMGLQTLGSATPKAWCPRHRQRCRRLRPASGRPPARSRSD